MPSRRELRRASSPVMLDLGQPLEKQKLTLNNSITLLEQRTNEVQDEIAELDAKTFVFGVENQVDVVTQGDKTVLLSISETPAFEQIALANLTPNRLVYSDGDQVLQSVLDFTDWIEGTDDQINVTNDGDGSITLSLDPEVYKIGNLLGVDPMAILYVGADRSISEDINNFVYDYTNIRVGLGIGTPGVILDIAGAAPEERIAAYSADANSPTLLFRKSRSATIGDLTQTLNNDELGRIRFYGVDNSDVQEVAAEIVVSQDGAAGVRVPGKIEFSTASVGNKVALRFDIDSVGVSRIGTPGTNCSKIELDGTLEFNGTATVFNDVPMAIATGKVPSSTYPNFATLIGNLKQYQFNIGDYINLPTVELLHGYKNGSDFEIHIHWCSVSDVITDRGVKWEVEYTIANSGNLATTGVGSVFPAPTTVSAEHTVPANTPVYTHMYKTIFTVATGTFNIGAIMQIRLKRIASVDDVAPTSDPFALSIGVHYEIDTCGSRTIYTK